MPWEKLAWNSAKQILTNPVQHFKNGLGYRYFTGQKLHLGFPEQNRVKDRAGKNQGMKRKQSTISYKRTKKSFSNKRRKTKSTRRRAAKAYKKKAWNAKGSGGGGNNEAFSSCQTVKKPSKFGSIYKAISNVSTVKNFFTYSVVGAGNEQGITTGTLVWTGKVAAPTSPTNGVIEMYTNAATARNNTTASTVVQNFDLGNNYKSQKYMLISATSRWRIANQFPTTTEVDIYDLVSKVTVNEAGYIAPQSAWNQGTTDMNANNPAYNSTTNLGANPMASKDFNIRWKIIKKTRLKLPGGKEHIHLWNYTANRIIDTEYFANNYVVKGLTHTIMVVARGSIGDSAQTAAAGTVAFCPTKLIIVGEVTLKSKLIGFWPRNYEWNNGLAALPSNIYEMNEYSGQVVNMGAGAGVNAFRAIDPTSGANAAIA